MADPLFILAPYRCFTSIVCAMLGQHPQMYGVPEVNLFVADTMWQWSRRPGRTLHTQGLLRTVAEIYYGSQTPRTIAFARGWIFQRMRAGTADVYMELTNFTHPRVLVDKSPSTVCNSENMQRMRRTFPSARYLHLLRHPRSFGESVLTIPNAMHLIAASRSERPSSSSTREQTMVGRLFLETLNSFDFSTNPPTLDPQVVWRRLNSDIRSFLADLPAEQSIWMRGEDLLARPEENLRRIAAWLGLRTDEEAVGEMMHPERSPFACFGPPGAPLGNDPGFLSKPHFRPGAPKKLSLGGPLSWRLDGQGFWDEVRTLANEYGYT